MDLNAYEKIGIQTTDKSRKIYLDSPLNKLVEKTVNLGQGHLSKWGALVVKTGEFTGRSAKDKYVVKSESTKDKIWWANGLNEITPENFDKLRKYVLHYLNEGKDLYVSQRAVGAHETHNIGVRLISTRPSHALFAKYLFRVPIRAFTDDDFVILHAPDLKLPAAEFGLKNETAVVTCFDTNTTIICGTLYAGEIKKSMFCAMNYVLPDVGVLPMHSGCNRLDNGQTSIFFGLSGTGKTTLSTDEGTYLIGDDEHGLSDEGVFNFEGGCYAKTYKLARSTEPGIHKASTRFGALLENVVLSEVTGEVDFFSKEITENGRSSYPLDFIKDVEHSSQGSVPKHMFFLTADAFGVLPPVAKLTREQAMFYFVLGYTSKLAGTEVGIKEPQATFSSCFGGPFMMRHPEVYAKLLGEYIDKHKIKVWLINTGWTGGPYGIGQRFPIGITRQIIRTIQDNTLNLVPTEKDPIFGYEVPLAIRNVPSTFLRPAEGWPSRDAYDKKAKELAESFHGQMKTFGDFYDANMEGSPTFGR